MADHDPVEEWEGELAQLAVFCRQREQSDFAALAMTLSRRSYALARSQWISWWNVL